MNYNKTLELYKCQAENDALRAELKEAQARHAASLFVLPDLTLTLP